MGISVKINLVAKQKLYIIASVFLIIVAIISVLVIIPVIKDIETLNQQIYEQRASLEKRYVQRFGMRKVIANFREINGSMGQALSIFLASGSEINFLTSLENRADINNVELKISLVPEEKDDYPDGKQKYDLMLTVEGGFKNVTGFINSIEKLNKYIILNSVILTQKADNKKGAVIASLKGYVYKNINL
ncbi:MAG: hypothetical protein HQ536_04875 [Parcubacteria group bacterium]|nr:hypothetical protein [Parcubacteria group bacterium]